MRQAPALTEIWQRGGPFVGADRPCTRVTVEKDFLLRTNFYNLGTWPIVKAPIRNFVKCDNSQIETEVPNIRTVQIDRSLDTDAGTCDITLSNQWMKSNFAPFIPPFSDVPFAPREVLGDPGYFDPNHGGSFEARARWNVQPNSWLNVLTPNALIRSYSGYGGHDLPLATAIANGNLLLTGVWLVDKVQITSSGELTLQCRDMGKLLLVQQLYPPLVPGGVYPLRYQRFEYYLENVVTTHTTDNRIAEAGPRRITYEATANSAWASGGVVHGHRPQDAFDGNTASFWLSVGNNRPDAPYAIEWLQGTVNEYIDTIYLNPWAGNYVAYVSIMENGAWVNNIGTIPYNPLSVGRYDSGAHDAKIPAVMRVGVPWETPVDIKLPRAFRAQRVRITLSNLAESQWGPYPYRGGLREMGVRLSEGIGEINTTSTSQLVERQRDGNYKDLTDIIKDLVLWSGWFCYEPYVFGSPKVYGNLENTGTYAKEQLPDDMFDKRPVMDAINGIKELVGFIVFVDEEGGFNFTSPNWWAPGNFFLSNGTHVEDIFELDELITLTQYSVQLSDESSRSEIIIATGDPERIDVGQSVVYYNRPWISQYLRGIVKPVLWTNVAFSDAANRQTMAELIGMHIFFRQRQGQVTIAANPCIGINDQVRIYERLTSESGVHYVRGYSMTHDLETGVFTQTLTTHQLTSNGRWLLEGGPR